MESNFLIFPAVIDEGTVVPPPQQQQQQQPSVTNEGHCSNNNNNNVTVQILLSRPHYRIGGTPVVGTILVTHHHQQQQHIREGIESLQFSMIGLCRYDPRWFNANTINMERNNSNHRHQSTSSSTSSSSSLLHGNNFVLPTGYVLPPHTLPFWTVTTGCSNNSNNNSNDRNNEPIELLNIKERNFGKWDDVNPMKPIQLSSSRRMQPLQHSISNIKTTATATNGNRFSNQSWHNNHNSNNVECDDDDDDDERRNGIMGANNRSTNQLDERHQLAYTFRVNLPQHHCTNTTLLQESSNDIQQQSPQPHTFHGVSCRYYYVIVVRVLVKGAAASSTTSPALVEWIQYPVTVLPAFHPNDLGCLYPTCQKPLNDTDSSNIIKIMAHANGLPTRLTAIELNQWEGRYTVNRLGSSLYRNITSHSAQTISIIDPTSQCMVGMLSIVGTPNNLHPGSRFTLKIDFPIHNHPSNPNGGTKTDTATMTKPIPCYQICACLQGKEIATISSKPHGSTTGSKQITARRYVWDTAHEMIDPDTTECVVLDLLVPETIPCSILTANVELDVQCVIDIAIGTTTTISNNKREGIIDYRNIHLEIPCQVRPAIYDWERANDDDAADEGLTSQQFQSTVRQLYNSAKQLRQQQQQQQRGRKEDTDDDTNNEYLDGYGMDFDTSDIQMDLKLLSIQMAKICNLQPKPYR